MQEAYEAACREHGHRPGPTLLPDRDHPSVVFVADDVDRAWSELGEHLLHDARTYAEWNPGNLTSAGFSHVTTVAELRDALASHVIISVPEAISRAGAGSRMAPPQTRGRRRVARGPVREKDTAMTGASTAEVYYDPFDFDIDDDPYPIWKRLRDEAPLYYNEKYNFYALSRHEDVARELMNFDTFRSGRGTTIDILMSGINFPPGVILFEDPPIHDVHRHVLSKVFTPRQMEAIEPLTRDFCV